MKTIKLFSLGLLLSLAWIACKNEATTEGSETEEGPIEVPYALSQSEVGASYEALSKAVNEKIAALEASLSTVDEDAKSAIGDEIAKYKGFESRLVEVGAKVASATEENWDDIKEEASTLHRDIKSAMTDTKADPAKAGQLSNQ